MIYKLLQVKAVAILIATVIIPLMLIFGPHVLGITEKICQRTILYTLTFHPQKEYVILCHPIGKALQNLNNANILFNKGVVAAQQHSTLVKCPNSNKNFCQGWNFVKKYG